MRIYLPYIGEFGGELLHFAPKINGLEQPAEYVYCEEGKSCLYPNAVVVHQIRLDENDTPGEVYKRLIGPIRNLHEWVTANQTIHLPVEKRFFKPDIDITPYLGKKKIDVVIFPRYKTVVHGKNWGGWEDLVEMLKAEGLSVFAAGSKKYSYNLNCDSAWDYDNCLEATIWALQNSKIRIGLITALHVLCAMCGVSSVVLTNKHGMSALVSNSPPSCGYLDHADHLGAGYELWPYLENKKRLVNEINSRISQ